MSKININELVRPNIRDLVPYSSARSEYTATGVIYLDANENSFGSALGHDYNRYPDPLQLKLKEAIAAVKNTNKDFIFLGNGSDEPIDLLIRSFCEPGTDNILLFPPTYGMYEVSAKINNVAIKEVSLTADFQLDVPVAIAAIDGHTKLIFICSPNNPTGNLINKDAIISLLENFGGIVVLDEAYIDFSVDSSLLPQLRKYPNLVILQTFSKAWGLAGLRLGMAFASLEIIAILNKVKAPYNINLATQILAEEAISTSTFITDKTKGIVDERLRLYEALSSLPFVTNVFPSDANFLLVRVTDAPDLYNYLKRYGIIVRNRSSMHLCDNTLRITIGNTKENELLIFALNQYKQ